MSVVRPDVLDEDYRLSAAREAFLRHGGVLGLREQRQRFLQISP
jgi:hypothetical protein